MNLETGLKKLKPGKKGANLKPLAERIESETYDYALAKWVQSCTK